MQVANVAARLKSTEYVALHICSSTSEQLECLICMNSKHYVIELLGGAIIKGNGSAFIHLFNVLHGRAKICTMPCRKLTLECVDVCFRSVAKRTPSERFRDRIKKLVVKPVENIRFNSVLAARVLLRLT
jgi:hypothetical protein